MTWQVGKLRPSDTSPLPLAPLRALATHHDEAATSVDRLAKALGGFKKPVRVHLQLVSGEGGETVEHWDVVGGKVAKAKKGEPKDADVIVVMRPETWAQIARGQLAPYEALYTGRLRVGGDFALAKIIVKHLSDPATPYVAPC